MPCVGSRIGVREAPGVAVTQVSVGCGVVVSVGSGVAVAGSGDGLVVGVGGVMPEATAIASAVAVSATAGSTVGRAVWVGPGEGGGRVAMGTATSQLAAISARPMATSRENRF